MHRKKILIVSNGFYPEISPRSFRATELAKEFARQGHQVKVISHERGDVREFSAGNGFSFQDMGPMSWPKPAVSGTGLKRLFSRVIVRLTTLLFEYPNIQLLFLVNRALAKESGFDLLISVAVPYPIHWGVAWFRSSKHPVATTWVADCGDPYMGQENDTFKAPFYFGWVEKWFCRKADYLSVPTKGSIGGYYPEFHYKIKVIPQGFRFEDYQMADFKPSEKVIFGYGGMFIPGKRDPKELIEFLLTVEEEHQFEFHIYTSTPQWVLPYIAGSKSIFVHSIVGRTELMHEFSKMDFVVNFTNIGTSQTPSKLIDYAILGKPILNVVTGQLRPADVLSFLDRDFSNSYAVTDREQYRIENVAQLFLNLIDETRER
ncbi:MAG: glycosyltransferase [Imperialibacter sp.]|uniref:glycosyltransferase n=1 Tax=Imperialibacter sp. TaxID=2038411 RepID=UPI0032ED5344